MPNISNEKESYIAEMNEQYEKLRKEREEKQVEFVSLEEARKNRV